MIRRVALPVLTVIIGFCSLGSAARSADWPHWRGNDYNGISPETDWKLQDARILWRANVGAGYSSVAVVGNRVYTQGNSGYKKTKPSDKDTITCLDAQTGKVVWTYSYPEPLDPKYYDGGTSATPTVDGERVYTISKTGKVFCLHAATGKVIWQKDIVQELRLKKPVWGFSGSPFIWDGLVILNAGDNGVALDKYSGKAVWVTGKHECGYATPVPFKIKGKTYMAIFNKDAVGAVEPATGKVIWEYPWKTKWDVNAADPIISGDKMFLSSGYNHGCTLIAFNEKGGQKVWQNRKMRNHFSSCVLWKGYLYGFDESTLKCLAFATGEEKWAQKKLGKGSLMMSADGRLIILSEKGLLVTARATPDGFQTIGKLQVTRGRCWTVPVLSNGRIYCRNYRGELVCVAVK